MSLKLIGVEKKILSNTHIYPINLELKKNSINVLLGPTLSGKTTLMQLMAGLDLPTSGKVYFNNQDVTGVKVQKRNVAMVYQQFINYPSLSVYENIASPLRVAGLDSNTIKLKVDEIATLLKLNKFLEKKPHELSGGQQQRTALARALIKDANLILLDEPLANLDFKLREELRDELPKIFERRDCIVVYATTDPMDALLIGGNIIIINEGNIVQYGKTFDVYSNPKNLVAAKVFNDPPLNIFDGSVKNKKINVSNVSFSSGKKLNDLADGNYKICVRPHHLKNTKENASDIEIEGKIKISEINGPETLIHFNFLNYDCTSLVKGIFNYSINEKIKFYFNPDNCLIFDTNHNAIH